MDSPYCQAEGCDRFREGNDPALPFCGTCKKAKRKEAKNKLKPTRERTGIQKVGTTNMFEASDGTKYNEQQIRERLTRCYSNMEVPFGCTAYPHIDDFTIDHDHTIAKARCKELHKTELIWDADNIEFSSRTAHQEWEQYKSGKFIRHANFKKRMAYMKKHDIEGWEKRMIIVADVQKPTQTI